jgi:hypothetical protein
VLLVLMATKMSTFVASTQLVELQRPNVKHKPLPWLKSEIDQEPAKPFPVPHTVPQLDCKFAAMPEAFSQCVKRAYNAFSISFKMTKKTNGTVTN